LHEQVGIGPDVVTRRILAVSKSDQQKSKTINSDQS
jgi:hypothetical protein